jgi:predicted ATP-dependent protease
VSFWYKTGAYRISDHQFAEFVKMATDEEKLRALDRSAVAALVEQAVRMSGRQAKISTSFPAVSDLIREADFWAGQENQSVVGEQHVDRTIEARIFRSNLAEERIQEMIDRGTLMKAFISSPAKRPVHSRQTAPIRKKRSTFLSTVN